MTRRQKILITVAAVLVLAILIPTIRHYQLRWATEAYIAQLKAQGEPMDLEQVTPPPVLADQNSAETMRQAAVLLNTEEIWRLKPTTGANGTGQTVRGDSAEGYDVVGMQMVAPGKAMILWEQPDIREGHSRYSWGDVSTVLAKNENTFALFQQIIGKPDFDFQIHYERGFDDPGWFTNLFLMESKRAALRLSTVALCDLHNGDTASAVENLRAMLAMTQALRDERFVISELVRIAVAQIAVDASWDLLQSPNLTDAQLAQLQQDWTALDFIQSYKDALEVERANQKVTVKEWRNSDSGLEHLFQVARDARNTISLPADQTRWNKVDTEPEFFMWRYWWSYPDQLCSLKGYQILIDTMRTVQTNGSFQNAIQTENNKLDDLEIEKLNSKFEKFFPDGPDLHMMLSMSATGLGGVIRRVMTAEVAKQTVVTAIALKRYQLKYGDYPQNLNALVPEFLPAVPLDPADGQPLRYHPKANGTFLLYSVGENGKDDGGNPSLEHLFEGGNFYWLNPHALDWVWPQPATEKEIQNYYAHPPQ